MSESVTLFQLGYRRAPGSPREWRRVRGPRQPGGHGVRGHSGEVSLVEGEIHIKNQLTTMGGVRLQ